MTKAQKARLDYIKTRHKRNYTLEGVDLALVDSQAGDVIRVTFRSNGMGRQIINDSSGHWVLFSPVNSQRSWRYQ